MTALAVRLAADGHPVASCAHCGRAYALDLDHDGHPKRGGRARRYCSRPCRTGHAVDTRTTRPPVDPALTERHRLEAAGQLSLDPTPLPALETP